MSDVAVVVPALDEADNLGALLDDLRRQTVAPREVVVVDAGSRDGTLELAMERAVSWPALRVLRVAGATPGRGRNEGIRLAASPVIATLDAGSRVGPGWLAALAGALGEHPDRRLVVGVAEADARSSFERAAGWFTLRALKPPGRAGVVGRDFLPAGRSGFCFGKPVWERVGGYPDELPWGEDKTFVRRARTVGVEVAVAPAAVVRWRPRRSPGELYRQYERYGRGDARARIDRQNELVPLGLMVCAAVLAARAEGGDRRAAVALVVAGGAYLALFTAAALRDLDDPRDAAWVPLMRVVVDVAKVHGFLAETVRGR